MFIVNYLLDFISGLFSYYCFIGYHDLFDKSDFVNNLHLKNFTIFIIINFRIFSGIELIYFSFVRVVSFPYFSFFEINGRQWESFMSSETNDYPGGNISRRTCV